MGVVLLLLGIAEFGMRTYIGHQLRQSVGTSEEGEKPSVSFGAHPLLLSLVTKDINKVAIETPNTVEVRHPGGSDAAPEIVGTPKASIKVQHLDISNPDAQIAEHLEVDTALGDDVLLAYLQQAVSEQLQAAKPATPAPDGDLAALMGEYLRKNITITKVTSNPADSTVTLEISGGAAAITLVPGINNGELAFTAKGATLFGVQLPDSVSQGLTEALRSAAGNPSNGMRFTDVRVEDAALAVSLEGEHVNINDLNFDQNLQRQASK